MDAGCLRVFAEGAVDARPTGVGGEVGLRRERFADADGAVLLANVVGEGTDESGAAEGGEAGGFGPFGEVVAACGGAEGEQKVAAGVGAEGERDAKAAALGELLQVVVLLGEVARRRGKAGEKAVDETMLDEVGGLGKIVGVAHADRTSDCGKNGLNHKAGDLFEGHLAEKIVGRGWLGTGASLRRDLACRHG